MKVCHLSNKSVSFLIHFRFVSHSQRVRGHFWNNSILTGFGPMLDFAGIWWGEGLSPPLPPPFAWCASIRYAIPGIAVTLAKTGPNRPRKVCLTLPKGPLLIEFTFDRFWAHVGPHHLYLDPGDTGLKWAKTAEKGSKQPQWSKKVGLGVERRGPLLKISIFDCFWAHLAYPRPGS